MSGEMIERVARAMCVIAIGGEYDGPTPRMWRECARAAIEAMRDPTKEMLEEVAPCPEHLIAERNDPAYQRGMRAATVLDQMKYQSRWQVMIDAALK